MPLNVPPIGRTRGFRGEVETLISEDRVSGTAPSNQIAVQHRNHLRETIVDKANRNRVRENLVHPQEKI